MNKNRREFIAASTAGLLGLGVTGFAVKASESENPCVNLVVELLYRDYRSRTAVNLATYINVLRMTPWNKEYSGASFEKDLFGLDRVDRSATGLYKKSLEIESKPLKIKDYQSICSKLTKKLDDLGIDDCFQIFFDAWPEELIKNGYGYICQPEFDKTMYHCSFVSTKPQILLQHKLFDRLPMRFYSNNPNMI